MNKASLTQDIQDLMHRALDENPAVPGVILEIDAPRAAFRFSHAIGLSDREGDAPLTCGHPVRVASNTKTFVATLLRAHRDGAEA